MVTFLVLRLLPYSSKFERDIFEDSRERFEAEGTDMAGAWRPSEGEVFVEFSPPWTLTFFNSPTIKHTHTPSRTDLDLRPGLD